LSNGSERGGSAYWQNAFAGGDRRINRARRFWSRLPAPPRCKICGAPFQGIGGALARLSSRRRSATNPLVCNACLRTLSEHPGGAEIDISVLSADIRALAAVADDTSAAEFGDLLQRFYRVAAEAIDENGGIVDKFLGDSVTALFIPLIAGDHHADRAMSAVRALFAAARNAGLGEAGMQLGAGLNSGTAFVGAVGEGDRLDFTALGDTVNIAAKLGAAATAGEALISLATWRRVGGPYAKSRLRTVPIPGSLHPVEAVIIRANIEAAI
jgi:adenylate cyclase